MSKGGMQLIRWFLDGITKGSSSFADRYLNSYHIQCQHTDAQIYLCVTQSIKTFNLEIAFWAKPI